MLLDNISQYLVSFAGRMEEKGVVNSETATKIRKYIRAEESPVHWELFLIVSGLIGAIAMSAGVFAIISHNWYDFPQHLRGLFSIVPTLVALYFYYRMLFHHKDSRVWVEASSMFLMLMIGASMALVSQTYEMEGDFLKFIKIWMALTIPLFYLARASGIALFYLVLILSLLFTIVRGAWGIPDIVFAEDSYWYWLFFVAFLPHFYLALNKIDRTQGVRVIFLSLCVYFTLLTAILTSIESNYVLWVITYNVAAYMFAKKFMGDNFWFFSRPINVFASISIAFVLLLLSNRMALTNYFAFESVFKMAEWEEGHWVDFTMLLVVLGGLFFNYFRYRESYRDLNPLILFSPVLILFLMFVQEYLESWWIITLIINLYILILAITTMINGSENGQSYKMFAGLLLIAFLFAARYFDVEIGFITKGLLFLCVGGLFFMINMFVKEKVDDIKRQKRLRDDS